MKLVHRQILKEQAQLFLLIGSCLLGLILVGRMLQLRDMLLSQDLGILDVLRLFLYLSPVFLLLLTPIACMLSVFLTFLRMSSDRELTALKASGVSLYQLLAAPVLFSFLCACFSLYIGVYGLPWGMEHFKLSLLEFARTKTKISLQSGVFNKEFPGLTIYAQKVNLNSGAIRFVFVQDKTSKSFTDVVIAPEGKVTTDPVKEQLQVVFRNGRIFRRDGEKLAIMNFGTYAVRLPLGRMLGKMGVGHTSPKEIPFSKLIEYNRNPALMKDFDPTLVRRVRVEIQRRIALPFACIVLGLFSVPIACAFRGLKQQHGLVLALGVFLIYYLMLSFAEGLDETSVIPPAFAVWLPNVIFAVAGAGFMHQAVHERVPPGARWLLEKISRRRTA